MFLLFVRVERICTAKTSFLCEATMAYTRLMWHAKTMWQLSFMGAISALIIGLADCALAGCGGGAAIISLRLCAICGVAAMLLYGITALKIESHSCLLTLLMSMVIVSPLAYFGGEHLSQTATLTKLVNYKYRTLVTTIAIASCYGLYLYWLVRRFQRSNTHVFSILMFLSTLVLFTASVYLKKLHYPLAVGTLFFCWMNLLLGFKTLLQPLSFLLARSGSIGFMFIGAAMTVWPVSLEDAFAASDQGIISRDITYFGRAHTMDELVNSSPAISVTEPIQVESFSPALPSQPGRSVILISIDALRPDHLGFNGYKRKTSPHIDKLLSESFIFENAYATAPTSSFSIPSIHAGMAMEEYLHSGAPLPPLMAHHFNQLNYTTVALYPEKIFSVGPSLMAPLKESAFGFERTVLLEMDARKDVAAATAILEKQPSNPLFMWVHFYDPHLPYDCHNKPFGDTPKDCYDAEIAYLDKYLGPFLSLADKKLDSPIIVLTADHGEAFGEHGRNYHSTDLYDEQIRVPLSFRIQGVAPKRSLTAVSNCNIHDTLVSLVQTSALPSKRNDLRPHMVAKTPGTPVVSAIGHKRSVVFNQRKLICDNWPKGACAMFDLAQDPDEKSNLAATQIQTTVQLLGLLKNASQQQLTQIQGAAPKSIILGRLKRSESKDGLFKLATTASSPFTEEASRLLAFLRDNSAAELLSQLELSTQKRVAAWASIGNGLLGNEFHHDNVLRYTYEHSDLGAWSAIILGRKGEIRAFKPLLKLLKDDEPAIRAQAALSLGKLGNINAVLGLIELLDIKQSRWAAIDALGMLEDQRAITILKELQGSDPDMSNLPRYLRAIERIKSN